MESYYISISWNKNLARDLRFCLGMAMACLVYALSLVVIQAVLCFKDFFSLLADCFICLIVILNSVNQFILLCLGIFIYTTL